MADSNEQIVRNFCAAMSRRDLHELLEFFMEDAVYHNMPLAAVKGRDAIAQVFKQFVSPAEEIDWEIVNISSVGDVVFTERVDRFVMGGKKVELPVAGVFEMTAGKISAWRDYFDMATFTNQAS